MRSSPEMAPHGDSQETLRRHLRRSLLVASLLVALFVPLDLRYGRVPAAVRIGWVSLLLACAALQRPRRPRLGIGAAVFAASASGVLQALASGLTYGSRSPRFYILAALPLVVLVLLPDLPLTSALVFLGAFGGGVTIILREGRGTGFLLDWCILAGTLAAMTLVGGLGLRRVWIGQLAAQRAHAETLQRLAESEGRRAQAERLAVVGRLAAGVAHEINNPLSFAKANLQFLKDCRRRGELDSSECEEALDEALHGVQRIAEIVNDMRSLAREPARKSERFCVGAAIEDAWRIASVRLAGLRSECEVERDLPPVLGSPRLLVQALVNLLANASDAAEAAPTAAGRWVRLRAGVDRGAVEIVVEDGGPGLSAEAQRRLFEPFFTTKGGRGTGLGLALVREHVARCGGTIEGANREGGGARFTVRLDPRTAAEAESSQAPRIRAAPDAGAA